MPAITGWIHDNPRRATVLGYILREYQTNMKTKTVMNLTIAAFTISLCLFGARTADAKGRNQQPPPAVVEQFATADDGTPLTWTVYPPAGSGAHPSVLVIHGGAWKLSDEGPQVVACAKDFAAAGFIAFDVEYRLAPPGRIPGQVSLGRYPDQTNDLKLAVIAARGDARSNGWVGAVGGSAGGAHSAFIACDGTPGIDRVDAAVNLSGAYRFDDQASWSTSRLFMNSVINYVGTNNLMALYAASPAAVVSLDAPPMLFVQSTNEIEPYSQFVDMLDALDAAGVTNYQTIVLQGRSHAFAYWQTIKTQAVAFMLGAARG